MRIKNNKGTLKKANDRQNEKLKRKIKPDLFSKLLDKIVKATDRQKNHEGFFQTAGLVKYRIRC